MKKKLFKYSANGNSKIQSIRTTSAVFWTAIPVFSCLTGTTFMLSHMEISRMEIRKEKVLSIHFPTVNLSQSIEKSEITQTTPLVFLPDGEVFQGEVRQFLAPQMKSLPERKTRHSVDEQIARETLPIKNDTLRQNTKALQEVPVLIAPEIFGSVGDLLVEIQTGLHLANKNNTNKNHFAVLSNPTVATKLIDEKIETSKQVKE